MHDCSIRPSLPRILALSTAVVAVTALGSGCGTSAKMSADQTAAAWSSDKYVPATDSRTASMNAARVLAMPERAADRTMQVGAISAVIHEKPSVTSKGLGVLAVGDAVKVVAEGDFVRQAATGNFREYVGEKGGDITPSWVKVKAGTVTGWVPARALVNPVEFATSSESMAASRGDGAKGFSSKVKLEATAMKGAAGTPKLKGANYAAADALIERMKSPMQFSVGAQPAAGPGRVSGLPSVGESLDKVDPAAAAAAAAAITKANEPSDFSKGVDGLAGAASQLGFKQADDPKVKLGIEVAKLVEYFTQPYPVTPAEERILGRECLAKLLGNGKVLPDASPVASYVRWVGAKVAANSTIPYSSMGLDFIVLEDRDVNAVAVPGGPVVITTGMLSFLDNEDELAAILAHETAHVEERHGLKLGVEKGLPKLPKLIAFCEQQSKGQFEPALAKILSDNKLPDFIVKEAPPLVSKELSKIVRDVMESATLAVVDGAWKEGEQGVETGADLRGLSLAAAAGYDPAALDAALERLKAKTGEYGGANYSPDRAALERKVLPLLPSPDGKPAAVVAASKDAPAVVRKVQPSKESADRWSKMDAELKRK